MLYLLLRCSSNILRWHADIKPDNILIIEEDGPLGIKMERFKLADPGFAKFVEKRGPDPMEVPLSGGTETYGNTYSFVFKI